MRRAIAAVVVAWVLWSILWVGMNTGAQALLPGLVDPSRRLDHAGVLSFYVVWSVVASLAAGYTCAWIGKTFAMKAVWTLAIVQLLIGIAIEASLWEMVPVVVPPRVPGSSSAGYGLGRPALGAPNGWELTQRSAPLESAAWVMKMKRYGTEHWVAVQWTLSSLVLDRRGTEYRPPSPPPFVPS